MHHRLATASAKQKGDRPRRQKHPENRRNINRQTKRTRKRSAAHRGAPESCPALRPLRTIPRHQQPGRTGHQRRDRMRLPEHGVHPGQHRLIPPFAARIEASRHQEEDCIRHNIQSCDAQQPHRHQHPSIPAPILPAAKELRIQAHQRHQCHTAPQRACDYGDPCRDHR
jgi:hypothetical protein